MYVSNTVRARGARVDKYVMRRFINLVESFAVTEAPVTDMGFYGDMETTGTFRDDDLKKIRNPEWQNRVTKILEKSPVDIGLYFLNGPEAGKLRFDSPHFKSSVDIQSPRTYVGLKAPGWVNIALGGLPTGYENRVNVILASNEGGDRVGLTPWIVAHRIGHCFLESNDRAENRVFQRQGVALYNIIENFLRRLDNLFDKHKLVSTTANTDEQRSKNVIKLVSPFRTARTGTIRNTGEYVVELFAQYLTSGSVTFNRINIGGRPATKRRELPEAEAELLNALKRKLGGFNTHPISNGWWETEMEWIWQELRDCAARPRTRDALWKMYLGWVKEGFFTHPTNPTDILNIFIDEAEENINAIFKYILDEAMGKFVIL